MAKIDSYVLATTPLSGSDKLIGTDTSNDNATKNFSINDLVEFISDSNIYVPYTGAASNINLNNKDISNVAIISTNYLQATNMVNAFALNVTNQITLNASAGTNGQVLTSQGSSLPPIWSSASTGAQGIQGPVGPAGPPGPVGPAGLNWQGAWSASGVYVVDDAVGYGGASWFCINNVGPSVTTPNLDTSNWALLAAQGATGPQGPAGAQGPTGPQGPAGASGNNTLQQVLTNSTSLTNGRNFQGTGAGIGNLGFNINGFGTNCAGNNSGSNVNAFGTDAADNNTSNDVNAFGSNAGKDNAGGSLNALGPNAGNGNTGSDLNALGSQAGKDNTGSNVNAIGPNAANGNTGINVNAFGNNAGLSNTFNNVSLLGPNAQASADDQLVFSNNGGFNAQVSNTNLTANRLYELPNNSGTIALTSDISFPYLVYTALLSYDGSSINVDILQNTLGVALNWTIPFPGTFRGTAASGTPFTLNKTWLTSGGLSQGSSSPYIVASQLRAINPTTQAEYRFFFHDGTIAGTPTFTNYSIEIRVYP